MAEYAHPESLVTTDWVAEHGADANVRLVEVDVDTTSYDKGHIAGALSYPTSQLLRDKIIPDMYRCLSPV